MTVYEYINEEWTRVTDRVVCTEIPEWNQESQTRILVFAPGDAVTEDEAEGEAPGETPPDGGGNDAPGDDDHPPDGEEKADEEEEIAEETQPEEPVLDPPEAGHETTYYAKNSSCFAKDPEHAPSGNVILPEHESPFATPGDAPTRGRALSDDSSAVGPFQTVDQVGEHPVLSTLLRSS